MRTRRWTTVLAAVFVLGALLAACGGNDSGGSTGSTGSTASTGATTSTGSTAATGSTSAGDAITIKDFAFDPSTLAVSGKTTITVTNDDTTTHTFTADDGSFDEEVPAGESVEVKVDISADTPYHCKIHPSMTGTLTAG